MTSGALAIPAEVAQYMRTTEAALAQQRFRGDGPKFIKRGRKVLYRWADIEEYLESQTVTRTNEHPGAA